MSEEVRQTQLCMARDQLDDLPAITLPAGYVLRTSRDGDGAHWARIMNEAFSTEHTADTFVQEMMNHPAYRPDRIFFIDAPDGTPCATASAYRQEAWGDAGYVHWVAVCAAHAGKKLGYIVSLAVLLKFREEGCTRAVLDTNDFRLPALKTYLRLGFRPKVVKDYQIVLWRNVLPQLGEPYASMPVPEVIEEIG